MRGAMLKVVGNNDACGVTLTKESGEVIKLEEDMITTNKPSELILLLPSDLADGSYTLTITTQYTTGNFLKEPRSISTTIVVGDNGGEERPGEL
jgi:hypothetical protein